MIDPVSSDTTATLVGRALPFPCPVGSTSELFSQSIAGSVRDVFPRSRRPLPFNLWGSSIPVMVATCGGNFEIECVRNQTALSVSVSGFYGRNYSEFMTLRTSVVCGGDVSVSFHASSASPSNVQHVQIFCKPSNLSERFLTKRFKLRHDYSKFTVNTCFG